MTRSELIQRLAKNHQNLSATDIDLVVRVILDEVARALSGGGRVEIRGFGSFEVRQHPVRLGRNPKTGEPVLIPAKFVPRFKVGKELRERVNPASSSVQ